MPRVGRDDKVAGAAEGGRGGGSGAAVTFDPGNLRRGFTTQPVVPVFRRNQTSCDVSSFLSFLFVFAKSQSWKVMRYL